MENKKLLKFLLKDISELEELFAEKGSEGFDSFEIEFIQSRFKGARQIIQILNEKDRIVQDSLPPVIKEKPVEIPVQPEFQSVAEEPVVEESLAEPAPILSEPEVIDNSEAEEEERVEQDIVEEEQVPVEEMEEEVVAEPEPVEEETVSESDSEVQAETESATSGDDMELDEEEEELVARTIGDSILKEKSVNDLMNNGSSKLENKLSNSPVSSIQGAIGINDRYQYIRELFDGSAETFSQTVGELDSLNNIQEAVSYLQQNYKWKKTETSLKFVTLVKRRFPNG